MSAAATPVGPDPIVSVLVVVKVLSPWLSNTERSFVPLLTVARSMAPSVFRSAATIA